MPTGIGIFALCVSLTSSLRLNPPLQPTKVKKAQTAGAFNKTQAEGALDNTRAGGAFNKAEEDCDRDNYKCWKKGGHSTHKKEVTTQCGFMWTLTSGSNSGGTHCVMDSATGCIKSQQTTGAPGYSNNAACTITIGAHSHAISSITGGATGYVFDVEDGLHWDHFDLVSGSAAHVYHGSNGPAGVTPDPGTTMTWVTDGSVDTSSHSHVGWQFCDSGCAGTR